MNNMDVLGHLADYKENKALPRHGHVVSHLQPLQLLSLKPV
jgi:hypothetical protein